LKAAEAAVQNDPALQFRVQTAELPVLYVFMMRWNDLRAAAQAANADWPMPASIRDTYDQFQTIAKKKNVTRLNEGTPGFGALEKALERAKN
jgi:hypothetical protein